MSASTTEAIFVLPDGQEILVEFDPDQPRGPDGRWRKLPGGQLNFPGLTPKPDTVEPERSAIEEKLATLKIERGSMEPFGDGTSTVWKAELEDGTPVLVKERYDVESSEYGQLRDYVDSARGLEHAQAAQRVADYLGVHTPKVKDRTLEDVGLWEGDVEQMDVEPDDEVQLQEFMPDFETFDYSEPDISDTEAERFALLDYLTGNTDRHDGNVGSDNGELTAIDMDLTFPSVNESEWGNAIEWTTEWGDYLAGSPLSPGAQKLIDDLVAHQSDWQKKLEYEDGLTPEETEAFWNRVFNVEADPIVPFPSDDAQLSTHYYSE